jgi:PIN domain nuclease of toxin-antitoxin system
MKPRSVLDASALLAYLQDEPGAERVAEALEQGCALSAANWAELLTKLADVGQDPDHVTATLEGQGLLHAAIELRSMDEHAAREVARLRSRTRRAGLSLGDRACLALGNVLQVPVLTTDRVWSELGLGLEVVVIR